MREMVMRERSEKVAFMRTIGSMLDVTARRIGGLFNLNIELERFFEPAITAYAREVYQEDYSVDLLRERAKLLRAQQDRIRKKRLEDMRLLRRLDLMGEFYDRELGPDLKPLPNERRRRRNLP